MGELVAFLNEWRAKRQSLVSCCLVGRVDNHSKIAGSQESGCILLDRFEAFFQPCCWLRQVREGACLPVEPKFQKRVLCNAEEERTFLIFGKCSHTPRSPFEDGHTKDVPSHYIS